MFPKTVFREKALARRARREAVDVRLQVTAPHEWLVVAGLGAVLIALTAFGLLGRVESGISVEAVLVQPGQRIDVVAEASGVVVDVLAAVGDDVARDQPIARLRTPETATAAGRIATLDVLAPRDGELVALPLTIGQRVGAGELAARVRAASDGPIEALGYVTAREAALLAPGARAELRLAAPGRGAPRVLPARVEEISPRAAPPPPWLADLGVEPPPGARRLRAALTGEEPALLVDGDGATLRIVLGHRSFASLAFGSGGD